MNYGELQTAVYGDSFGQAKYEVRVKRWLNDAYRRIARRVRFDTWTVVNLSVVAGSSSAVIPSPDTVERIESVVWYSPALGNAGWPLDLVSIADIDEYDVETGGAVDLPQFYAKTGDLIEFRPASSVAGTLRVRQATLPARMTADGDVPAIPDDYHELLVTYARAFCYRDEDDLAMYDALMQGFENELARMKVDVQATNEDGPIQIRGTF